MSAESVNARAEREKVFIAMQLAREAAAKLRRESEDALRSLREAAGSGVETPAASPPPSSEDAGTE